MQPSIGLGSFNLLQFFLPWDRRNFGVHEEGEDEWCILKANKRSRWWWWWGGGGGGGGKQGRRGGWNEDSHWRPKWSPSIKVDHPANSFWPFFAASMLRRDWTKCHGCQDGGDREWDGNVWSASAWAFRGSPMNDQPILDSELSSRSV